MALYPPPPPFAMPPLGGERSLGPKSIENTRRQRNFYKAPRAPKLINTVILWYRFLVQPPPPPCGGGTVTTFVGRLQGGGRYNIIQGSRGPLLHGRAGFWVCILLMLLC